MKHKKNSPEQNQPPADTALSRMAAAGVKQAENDFVPAPDEVARRAYFSYVNQGSASGHEVQHWLEAEKQLLAERGLTRTHGYPHHNHTNHHQP